MLSENTKFYLKSLFITLGLCLVYRALVLVPLPFLDFKVLEGLGQGEKGQFGLLLLGFMPAISAFLIIEILSFFIPPLKTWRQDGLKGRRKLNQLAITTTLPLALYQSYGISKWLITINYHGSNLVSNPNILFFLITVFSLTAGVFLLVWIAQLITKFGIGNGFLIIHLAGLGVPSGPRIIWANYPLDESFKSVHETDRIWAALTIIFFIAFVFLMVKWLKKENTIEGQFSSGNKVNFELPPFPQGITAVNWAVSLVLIPSYFSYYFDSNSFIIPPSPDTWSYLVILCILTPLTSLLCFYLFCHPKRIKHNLFGLLNFDGDSLHKLKPLLIQSTLILVLGIFLFQTPHGSKIRLMPSMVFLNFVSLVVLFAILLDLIEQAKFMLKNGKILTYIELDNVHLASYLKGLLKAHEIPCHIQALHYRRLFYFLAPLYKMRLLVAEQHQEKVRDLFDLDSLKII